MIDFAARVDELAHFLATQFRIEDSEAIEILLAVALECPRTPACWLVLETMYSRDCSPAWFSFGETWLPESLPLLRSMRPRNANQRSQSGSQSRPRRACSSNRISIAACLTIAVS